jgi:hypothetical protein
MYTKVVENYTVPYHIDTSEYIKHWPSIYLFLQPEKERKDQNFRTCLSMFVTCG